MSTTHVKKGRSTAEEPHENHGDVSRHSEHTKHSDHTRYTRDDRYSERSRYSEHGRYGGHTKFDSEGNEGDGGGGSMKNFPNTFIPMKELEEPE